MDQTPGLNRRELLGSAAAVGVAAGTGVGLAAVAAPPMTPVVSVHLDVPFVDAHGAHQPYRPPVRTAGQAGLVESHELF